MLGRPNQIFVAILALIAVSAGAADMEIGLYSGIENVVRLGDSEAQIQSRGKAGAVKADVTEPPELVALKVNQQITFPDVGVRAYLKAGRVLLIEVQEPFQGKIQGKKVDLFPFARPPGKSWEEWLTRQLGQPNDQAIGGRLGSNALFYSWGDIAYNGMGPNQLAIYRDKDLLKYRQHNFGRLIQFFQK